MAARCFFYGAIAVELEESVLPQPPGAIPEDRPTPVPLRLAENWRLLRKFTLASTGTLLGGLLVALLVIRSAARRGHCTAGGVSDRGAGAGGVYGGGTGADVEERRVFPVHPDRAVRRCRNRKRMSPNKKERTHMASALFMYDIRGNQSWHRPAVMMAME